MNEVFVYFFPNLSVIQFLLREQTLRLYRDFLRLIQRVDNETNKKELKEWIRNDFKANKHHIQEVFKLFLINN
jgi:hypothetical protein